MLISEAIESFLAYQRSRKNRSVTTIVTYKSALNCFIDHIGDIELKDLKVATIDEYASYLVQFNFATATFKNRLTPIRSMVKYLYSKEFTDIRPESIDIPTVKDTEANFLTHEEQQMMVVACKNPREKVIILFLIRSGVRVSELIDIRTDDLYDRSIVVRNGKGGKSRITFVSSDAERAIVAYARSEAISSEWLIHGATGKQLSRQYIHRLVKQISIRAGIKKDVSPHTLRHTFATNLLMSGARIEDVQKMMGHANIRTTLIYMHFTNDYLKSKYDECNTIMLS